MIADDIQAFQQILMTMPNNGLPANQYLTINGFASEMPDKRNRYGTEYIFAYVRWSLAWFGMWMGMTSRKTSIAVLKTVCVVCMAPFLAEMFLQVIGSSRELCMEVLGPSGKSADVAVSVPNWVGGVLVGLADLTKNLFFIFWKTSRRLLKTFHWDAAGHNDGQSSSCAASLAGRAK